MEGLHKPSGSVDHSQSTPDLRASRAVHSEDNDSDLVIGRADLFDEPGSSDGVSIRSILSAYSDEFHSSQELRDVDAKIHHKISQLTKAIAECIRDRDDEIAYGMSLSERQMHSFRTVAQDRNAQQLQELTENLTDLEKERGDLLKAMGNRDQHEHNSIVDTDELIGQKSSSNEGSHVRPKNRIRTTREVNPLSDTGDLPKQLSPLRRMANSALISAAVIVVPIPVMVLATAWAPGLDLGGVLAITSGLVLGVDAFVERASLRHVLAVMVFSQFQAIDMGIRLMAERLAR